MDLLSKGKKLLLSVSRDTLLVLMNCKGSTAVRKKGEAQQCPPHSFWWGAGGDQTFSEVRIWLPTTAMPYPPGYPCHQ